MKDESSFSWGDGRTPPRGTGRPGVSQKIEEIRALAEMAVEAGHEYVGFDPKTVLFILAELDQRAGWRTDWENAPKDGRPMFLHWDWEPLTVVGYHGPTEGTEVEDTRHRWRLKYDSSDLEDGWGDPTHFMLITPPTEAGGKS